MVTRIHLNKRILKRLIVVFAILAVVLLLLKLVSVWDSKLGAVDVDRIQSAQPPAEPEILVPDVSVREPTEEERQELSDGTITKEELIEDLVEDAVVVLPEITEPDESLSQTPDTGQDIQPQPTQPIQTEYERRMAEIIAEVYVLRDEYIITLENMFSEAETALSDLASQDGTEEEFAALVSSYLSRSTELEMQCDARIDVIAAEMETLILENGGNMSLLDTLIETYANEKATKKAWYLDRLEEKGLIS